MIETSKQMWASWAMTDLCFDGNLSDVKKRWSKIYRVVSCFMLFLVCTPSCGSNFRCQRIFSKHFVYFSNFNFKTCKISTHNQLIIQRFLHSLLAILSQFFFQHFRLLWPFEVAIIKRLSMTSFFNKWSKIRSFNSNVFCFFLSTAIFTKFFNRCSDFHI